MAKVKHTVSTKSMADLLLKKADLQKIAGTYHKSQKSHNYIVVLDKKLKKKK